MSEVDDFLAEMANLRAAFLADVPKMLDAIKRLMDVSGIDQQSAEREELIRKVHSLAGTSETFGQAGLGEAARALEDLLSAGGSVEKQVLQRGFARLCQQA